MKSIHRLRVMKRLHLSSQSPITPIDSHLRTSISLQRAFSLSSIKASQAAAASRSHPPESSQSSNNSRSQKPLFPENKRATELNNEIPGYLDDIDAFMITDKAYQLSSRRRSARYGNAERSDDPLVAALRGQYGPKRTSTGQSYPLSRPSLILPSADPAQEYLDRLKRLDHSANLKPRLGTMVRVQNNENLSIKLRQFSALAIRNRIPAIFNRQRFHERPGLKRKRLKRERWRRRFMGTFKRICERVNHLSKQGW
jgi:small subunit ribosomal protein MRP21